VTIVQTGSTPERLAALETRRVSGSTLVPPATFIAQGKGFHVLADVSALGLAYQHQGGVTTRNTCAALAWSEISSNYTTPYTGSNRPRYGVKIAAKYLRLEDKELLQKPTISSTKTLPAKQYPTLAGLKTILDQLAPTHAKAKAAKPQDFVDARFVEEFDKSGYIDSLYGRKK
jgi:hypothetical protein